MLKYVISRVFKILPRSVALRLVKYLNNFLREAAYFGHGLQMEVEWMREPVPEWLDHNIDLYYYWPKTGNSLWLERGCFNLLAIKQNAKVLDLCCGDGFFARYFYSIRSLKVTAIDFDEQAIKFARKYNPIHNIEFLVGDIRNGLPFGKFDNIIWNAAIEHFTVDEIINIVKTLKTKLKKNGVISGYTILRKEDGEKQHFLHEYEFSSKEDLARFFTPHFKKVKIFETDYPTRKNLYFLASDGILPFDESWTSAISFKHK